MLLSASDIRINIPEYLPIDIARRNKAIPFEVGSGKIKVCFSNTANQRMLENMRLLFLNKGLIMERYITFDSIIDEILTSMEIAATEKIDVNADISELVNSIIKNGMEKERVISYRARRKFYKSKIQNRWRACNCCNNRKR